MNSFQFFNIHDIVEHSISKGCGLKKTGWTQICYSLKKHVICFWLFLLNPNCHIMCSRTIYTWSRTCSRNLAGSPSDHFSYVFNLYEINAVMFVHSHLSLFGYLLKSIMGLREVRNLKTKRSGKLLIACYAPDHTNKIWKIHRYCAVRVRWKPTRGRSENCQKLKD